MQGNKHGNHVEEDLPEGEGEANDMLAASEELEGGRFVPRGLE